MQYKFSGKSIDCFFDADFSLIEKKLQKDNTVFITDENIYSAHTEKFSGWKTIVIKAGEQFKNQQTVDSCYFATYQFTCRQANIY